MLSSALKFSSRQSRRVFRARHRGQVLEFIMFLRRDRVHSRETVTLSKGHVFVSDEGISFELIENFSLKHRWYWRFLPKKKKLVLKGKVL